MATLQMNRVHVSVDTYSNPVRKCHWGGHSQPASLSLLRCIIIYILWMRKLEVRVSIHLMQPHQ